MKKSKSTVAGAPGSRTAKASKGKEEHLPPLRMATAKSHAALSDVKHDEWVPNLAKSDGGSGEAARLLALYRRSLPNGNLQSMSGPESDGGESALVVMDGLDDGSRSTDRQGDFLFKSTAAGSSPKPTSSLTRIDEDAPTNPPESPGELTALADASPFAHLSPIAPAIAPGEASQRRGGPRRFISVVNGRDSSPPPQAESARHERPSSVGRRHGPRIGRRFTAEDSFGSGKLPTYLTLGGNIAGRPRGDSLSSTDAENMVRRGSDTSPTPSSQSLRSYDDGQDFASFSAAGVSGGTGTPRNPPGSRTRHSSIAFVPASSANAANHQTVAAIEQMLNLDLKQAVPPAPPQLPKSSAPSPPCPELRVPGAPSILKTK